MRDTTVRLGRAAGRYAVSPLLRHRINGLDRPAPRALLVAVYTERHEVSFRAVVEQALSQSWEVRLWALDRPSPALAPYTRATGPTARLAALHQMATAYEPHDAEWIVLCDDDVAFVPRGLSTLVALCSEAALTLAQPAQNPFGFPSHEFTHMRPFSVVRETGYVECGPTVCIQRSWWDRLIAPCVDMGMGWGAELVWSDQRRAGARLGIIDAVPVTHLAPPGQAYSQSAEKDRTEQMLAERGLTSVRELQVTLATWRPWRRHPPWVATA